MSSVGSAGERRASPPRNQISPPQARSRDPSAFRRDNVNPSSPQPSGRDGRQCLDEAYKRQLDVATQELLKVQEMFLQRSGKPLPDERPQPGRTRSEKEKVNALKRQCQQVNDLIHHTDPAPRAQSEQEVDLIPYTSIILEVLQRISDPIRALSVLNEKLKVFMKIREERGAHTLNDETIRQHMHAIRNLERDL